MLVDPVVVHATVVPFAEYPYMRALSSARGTICIPRIGGAEKATVIPANTRAMLTHIFIL